MVLSQWNEYLSYCFAECRNAECCHAASNYAERKYSDNCQRSQHYSCFGSLKTFKYLLLRRIERQGQQNIYGIITDKNASIYAGSWTNFS